MGYPMSMTASEPKIGRPLKFPTGVLMPLNSKPQNYHHFYSNYESRFQHVADGPGLIIEAPTTATTTIGCTAMSGSRRNCCPPTTRSRNRGSGLCRRRREASSKAEAAMLATVIGDMYGRDQVGYVALAMTDLCSPFDTYGWSSAGVYMFWIPVTGFRCTSATAPIWHVGFANTGWFPVIRLRASSKKLIRQTVVEDLLAAEEQEVVPDDSRFLILAYLR